MPEQLLPTDLQAERSLVACLMVDSESIDLTSHLVDAEDFDRDEHRWIFEAAQTLWARGAAVNQVTVATELSSMGKLDTVTLPYLSKLTTELPTAIGAEFYAETVRRMATLRKAITAGSNIVKMAYDKPADVDGFLAECEREIGALTGNAGGEMTKIGDLLDRYWDEPGVMSRETNVLRTGWGEVDKILCGIAPGNLAVVAARPGMGKSNVLLNIARNAAIGQSWRVAIVSLEMDEDEWRDRLLASETGITIDTIRGRNLGDGEQQQRAFNTSQRLTALPIYVHDKSAQSVEQIRAYAKRIKATGGLDLLVVDYLQLIGGNRGRNRSRYEEVTDISRNLKVLARDLHVPVLAAAQLNRGVEERRPPRPLLSDLRDSGAIEQDADQVMMLYRADKYVDGESPGLVEVIVNKNRHGPTGSAYVRMFDATAKILELEVAAPAMWSE